MSKVAIVYWSGTGNTEAMADLFEEGVTNAGGEASLIQCSNFSSSDVSDYDAFAFGAAVVIVHWSYDTIIRELFLDAELNRIEEVPAYKKAEMEYLLEKKASRLGVRSSDPGAFNGVAPEPSICSC